MMMNLRTTLLAAAISTLATPAMAADLTVEITNLTRGIAFTPLLVAGHDADTALFMPGEAASANLQKMAEGGDISGLSADVTGAGGVIVDNPAAGLLLAGQSASTDIDTGMNTQLSIVAMMLPTNDGFVALNSLEIPTLAGTYYYDLNGYDAGTEANDEMRGSGAPGEAGFPVPEPLDASIGMSATGIAAVAEEFVHIHRNVLGDSDLSGGVSDIDSTVHRWLNPVARVTLTVK
ncbi:spondin domain-containing protein [Oceanobacter sp. 4_MG-2023]|uniref:spondin domain-containing protein n=1 Tax=Oceanobacter sp. 4_MG-2023 TaxID=3062623 RepID=UPI0027360E21|nr:spondin domain-containing protein [Oceanobacter sp. 4_MG-2023]MDP2546967.1 spondin domain-containing protein [Oceanobacter sp. 4_MG-2023]